MREIILIDLGSVYWAAWHSSANEAVSAAHDRAVSKVRSIANGQPFVAVCCDSPKSWRKKISPTYKAQRPEKDHASLEQLDRTKATLRRDGYLLWEAEGFEADDIIATASIKAAAKGDSSIVHSADKDLLQLVGPKCLVITTTNGTRMDAAAVLEKWGVQPSQMADALAICGDKSDNIAGVPGVGPVGAAKLLKRFGTIEALIAELEKPDPIATPAVDKALRESIEVMTLAKQLTTLSWDAPIKYEDLFEERQVQSLTDEPEDYVPNLDQEEHDVDGVLGPDLAAQQTQPQTQIVSRDEQPANMTPMPPVKTTALARDTGLQPMSLSAALDFAKAIYNSRLYTKFPNPEAIFAVIVRGREMGMGALTALDSFHVIEGKPAPLAHLIVARAKAHPDCEYFRFVGGDDSYAEYQTKNRNNPSPTTLKFTIEQARISGLAPREPRKDRPAQGKDDRGNWEKRPSEMLRKTCAVQLARIEYPDAALGLYSAEEMGLEVA
jgi:5'-3' exonuclease